MARNVFPIPEHLYEGDLPSGYDCHLFVGRMAGRLSNINQNQRFTEFTFEIADASDPTAFVLRYSAPMASGEELARWENVGDTVGIVIAANGQKLSMVMAYNFTRRKWFATGYYPHRKDRSRFGQQSWVETANSTQAMIALGTSLILACGLGIFIVIAALSMSARRSRAYSILNPQDFRGDTAGKIATWIAANANSLGSGGNRSIDPSI